MAVASKMVAAEILAVDEDADGLSGTIYRIPYEWASPWNPKKRYLLVTAERSYYDPSYSAPAEWTPLDGRVIWFDEREPPVDGTDIYHYGWYGENGVEEDQWGCESRNPVKAQDNADLTVEGTGVQLRLRSADHRGPGRPYRQSPGYSCGYRRLLPYRWREWGNNH